MYFIEKRAVYSHGVFWIGESLDDAKIECDRLAKIDCDDHHEYQVLKFGILNRDKMPNGSIGNHYDFSHDPVHAVIYSAPLKEI